MKKSLSTSKNANYVYAGSASDIHLLHPKNPTESIVANFINALSDADARLFDIFFLPGDIFDSLGLMNHKSLGSVIKMVDFIFTWARENNIIVRVLEGTPSHDRNQSRIFESTHLDRYPEVNFKYVRELCIEHIPEINKNVLYIPDEWRHDVNDTLTEVKNLLKSKGLTKFDIGCFHGQMDYQLPAHVTNVPKHDSSVYKSLCNDVIFIGHVHTYSRNGCIVAQGSFDRLVSGEEGPKGHVRVKIYQNHELDVKFIENKGAMRFDTVTCYNLDLPEIIQKIERQAALYQKPGWMRIEAEKNALIFEHLHTLSDRFPHIKWTKFERPVETEEDDYDDDHDGVGIAQAITITPDNLYSLLIERIQRKCHDSAILDVIEEQLNEVI